MKSVAVVRRASSVLGPQLRGRRVASPAGMSDAATIQASGSSVSDRRRDERRVQRQRAASASHHARRSAVPRVRASVQPQRQAVSTSMIANSTNATAAA